MPEKIYMWQCKIVFSYNLHKQVKKKTSEDIFYVVRGNEAGPV